MKIIPKYILRHFLKIFGLALCAFTSLYLVIDFFEKIDNLLEKNVSFHNIVFYFVYKTPGIITQGIPLAALMGALIGLGILKKNREIVALRAAGIGSGVFAAPILIASLLLTLLHFGLDQTAAHMLKGHSQRIWNEAFTDPKNPISWSHENLWYQSRDRIYQIRLYDAKALAFETVTVFRMDPSFNLAERIDAKRLQWDGSRWIGEEVMIHRFNGSVTEQQWNDRVELDLPARPDDFTGFETRPEALSWKRLNQQIDKNRAEGRDPTPYEVERQMRLAFPATTLVMALLGIAVALRQRLHSGIAMGVVVALGVAFLYLTALRIGSALAAAEILPVILGVWLGNLIFASAGAYLWMTDDQ